MGTMRFPEVSFPGQVTVPYEASRRHLKSDRIRFRPENIRLGEEIHAAEEAYRLVREQGLPFREAYRRVRERFRPGAAGEAGEPGAPAD